MAKVSRISNDSSSADSNNDWYEAIRKDQPDSIELTHADQQIFHYAFECFSGESYAKAYEGFIDLAEKGSAIAQYFIGVMCLKGLGVIQDFSQAHMWFNIASAHGHRKARSNLEKLTRQMSPDQIGEAQKLAREWVSRSN